VVSTVLASLLVTLFHPAAAAPHPLHTTVTEIRVERGAARITIRAFADDFGRAARALRADAAAPDRMDDALAFTYVRTRLTLEMAGREVALRWCGQQRSDDAYLLCVTASGVTGLAGLRVVNRMHTELYADQVNLVHAVHGRERVSLLFLRGDDLKPLVRRAD
jgi:hypothetical protein